MWPQVSFLDSVAPVRSVRAKSLISSDTHTGKGRYKFTYAVEVLPVCKNDLVYLPTKTANKLGHIARLCLCSKVSNVLHLHDPTTLQTEELQSLGYWKAPFKPVLSCEHLQEFVVLDVEFEQDHSHAAKAPRIGEGGGGGGSFKKIRMQGTAALGLAEVTVARRVDFGATDRTERALSSLGNVLRVGDYAWGYMVAAAAFSAGLEPNMRAQLPDVILVKKSYSERRKRARGRRVWKLHLLPKEDDPGVQHGREIDTSKYEADYEDFMQELEEDPALRSQINLYRDPESIELKQKRAQHATFVAAPSDSDGELKDDEFPDVGLDELLEELTLGADESDLASLNMLPTQHMAQTNVAPTAAQKSHFSLLHGEGAEATKFNFL